MSATGFTGIVVIVLFLGLMIFFSIINKEPKQKNIRPIQAYNKINQEINVAVEDGTQLHISLGRGGITGPESASALAGLSILKQVIEKSSVCDYPPVASTGNAVISILAQDTIQGTSKAISIADKGDTLPNEEILSQEFDVSRGVLREATKVLVKKGLIRLKPKIGTQIQPKRQWNLFDPDVLVWKFEAGDKMEFLENIIEVRRIIESEAAKLAAERAGEEEVSLIRSSYDKMVRFLDDKDGYSYEEYNKLDIKFHTSILEACRNELFSQIGYTIRQALLTARQSDKKGIRAQKEILPLHLDIVNAIENHKPEAAYGATQALVCEIWKEIKQKISR